jgi:hypothetical protein
MIIQDGVRPYPGRTRYNKEESVKIRENMIRPKGTPQTNFDNLKELKIARRKRGMKGGVLNSLRKRFSKPPFPSIILTNAQSLCGKMDQLRVLTRFDNSYRESCLLAFSETWLKDSICDAEVALEGFTIVRADRGENSGKHGGGGVCLYINNRWCSDSSITVHERSSTPL